MISLEILGSSPAGRGATAQHFVSVDCESWHDLIALVDRTTERFPGSSAAWLDGAAHGTFSFPTRSARLIFARQLAREYPAKFTWTVQFTVDASWVADGFDLTDERAHNMLANDLAYAYGHELQAKVIASPDRAAIRRAQGYVDA